MSRTSASILLVGQSLAFYKIQSICADKSSQSVYDQITSLKHSTFSFEQNSLLLLFVWSPLYNQNFQESLRAWAKSEAGQKAHEELVNDLLGKKEPAETMLSLLGLLSLLRLRSAQISNTDVWSFGYLFWGAESEVMRSTLERLTWSCWTVVKEVLDIPERKAVRELLYQVLDAENPSMDDKSAVWYWEGKFSFCCDHWDLCNIMERLAARAGLAKPEKEGSVTTIDAQTDLNLEHVREATSSQSLVPYTKRGWQRSRGCWGRFW